MHSFKILTNNLHDFTGNGLLFTLFLVALVFLLIKSESGYVKVVLVGFSLYILFVYFSPVWVVYVNLRDDSEILYRLLWLLPISLVICYAATVLLDMIDKKRQLSICLLMIVLIVLSGDYLYDNEYIKKAENVYHVPNDVVSICKQIEIPGREVRACFPDELIQYVRQYTAYTYLPYGRTVFLEDDSHEGYLLQDILNQEVINTDELVNELRKSDCHYLIVGRHKVFARDIRTCDYSLIYSTEDYLVYIDNKAYLGL